MNRLLSLSLAACVVSLILGGTVWLDGAPGGSGRRAAVERLASTPAVSAALAQVDEERDRFVDAWIALATVPASSGEEEQRAAVVEREMAAMGLLDVRRDPAGNVIGVLPGADRQAKKAVFMAHMDTVAPPGADFTIHHEGDRLRGPGVRDDSSGLSALLAAARLAVSHGVVPPADVLVVASVEEEVGLNGSRTFLEAMGGQVGAFVAVDGYLGQVSYAATSIFWTRMHFRAPGAHTLRSFEHPSATLALARAVEDIYRLKTPRRPEENETWINVGMLGGGEVPNAMARDAWFTVDLRSNDLDTALVLEQRLLEIGRKAAREVGVAFDHEVLQRLEGASIEGHQDSTIVQTAKAALEHVGWGEVRLTPRGTADHNIAIQMGIPAVAVGVTTGQGAHTPEEVANIEPYFLGLKQLLLLMGSDLS